MKRFFLIPLMTMLCVVMAWGNVAKISVEGQADAFATSLTDLNSKIAALTDPATVTLLEDIEITNMDDNVTLVVPAGKNVVLNLNGHGIVQNWKLINTAAGCTYQWTAEAEDWMKDPSQGGYASAEAAYNDGCMPGMPAFMCPKNYVEQVCGGGDIDVNALIFNQGTLRIISEGKKIVQMFIGGKEEGADPGSPTTICNDGNLTIEGGIFIGPNGGFDLPKCPVIWAKSDASNITIKGGTFLCYEGVSDYQKGADWGPIAGPGTWNIQGGIFSSDEMAGTPLKKTGGVDNNKYATDHYLEGKLANNYTTILVPYSNANIEGYNYDDRKNNLCPDSSLMADANYYKTSDYKNKYRFATKPICIVVPETASTDNYLYVAPDATLTVADGETLHVGEGGIVMGDATAKIVVAAGGKLISEGEIVTSTPNNLHLTMDEVNKKYSYVAFNTVGALTKHPDATVVLKTKAKCDNGVYTYQRFAVPTYRNDIARKQSVVNTAFTYDNVAAPTAIYRWDYTTNDWVVLAPAGDDTFEPFQGYDLTTSAAAAGTEYTFKCELVGRGDAILPLQEGKKWQYFANSYTAPIDIVKLVTDLSTNRSYLNAGVWVHRINGSGWDAIGMGDVDDYIYDQEPMLQYSIQPMQAFVYNLLSTPSTTVLDYNEFVFNPFLQALNNNAPKRGLAATSDYTRATIAIEAADGTNDLVKVYEGSVFDASINNGYDMPKLMNEEGVNMYFNAAEGDLARFASDNVDNTAITLETKEATSYTVSFSNVTLAGYALRDNLTGTETELVSGNTYSFSAPANSKIEGRFEIVAVAKMPTAIENTEVKANAKGIYTLMGQYLGEDFHALPAGVYIINGKKVVK